jgi:hypothetical protein
MSNQANESLKDDRKRGLYGKFAVSRADGKSPGRCFVLPYDKDPFARVALAAYADACESEYPLLASDLRADLEFVNAVLNGG